MCPAPVQRSHIFKQATGTGSSRYRMFVTSWLGSTIAWKWHFLFTMKHALWKMARIFFPTQRYRLFSAFLKLKMFYWRTMLARTAICCSPPIHASVTKPSEFIYKTDKRTLDGKQRKYVLHTRSCFHHIKLIWKCKKILWHSFQGISGNLPLRLFFLNAEQKKDNTVIKLFSKI